MMKSISFIMSFIWLLGGWGFGRAVSADEGDPGLIELPGLAVEDNSGVDAGMTADDYLHGRLFGFPGVKSLASEYAGVFLEEPKPNNPAVEDDGAEENFEQFRFGRESVFLSDRVTAPGLFPDIDSRKFELGYGLTMSIGEQLLYGVGMVLLQMTAQELDRQINSDMYYRTVR